MIPLFFPGVHARQRAGKGDIVICSGEELPKVPYWAHASNRTSFRGRDVLSEPWQPTR